MKMMRPHKSKSCLALIVTAIAWLGLGQFKSQAQGANHFSNQAEVVAGFAVLATNVHSQTNPPALTEDGSADRFRTHVSLRPPAVEEVNGKIGYAGGSMDSSEGHNFDGSISLPISHQFGFQADALYSRIGGMDFYGGAGHLFWRNPDFGLIGVTGGYLTRQGVDSFQVGAEGEYYFDRFTFGFFAGVGSIRYANAAPFINTSPTRFIGRLSADWYALEDLRLGVSYTTAYHNNLVKAEAEYQTPIRGMALTTEVATGDHGYDHWLLGVRYYFGGNKSLRDRHRRDDPKSLMPQILHGLGLYGAEFRNKGLSYLAANPGTGSLGEWGSVLFEASRIRSYGSIGNGSLPPLPPTDVSDLLSLP